MVQVHRVTAAMARGKRPVSFRTRKLSLSAPMVLPWRRGGRVGRRRTTIPEGAPASVLGPLRHARTTGPPAGHDPGPDVPFRRGRKSLATAQYVAHPSS